MCLGLPGRVVSIDEESGVGRVEIAGAVRDIDLSMLHGAVTAGDHVLVHSGIALERLSEERADEVGTTFFA